MVQLTESESLLFDFLNQVYKAERLNGGLWIVGRWIRDKLLQPNRVNLDLEILIGGLTGSQFGQLLWEQASSSFQVANIKSEPRNPSMCRFAESTHIYLKQVQKGHDANNLFHIVVTWIPNLDQHLVRRDFTIDSIVYNVLTRRVEHENTSKLSLLKMQSSNHPVNSPTVIFRAIRLLSQNDQLTVDPQLVEIVQSKRQYIQIGRNQMVQGFHKLMRNQPVNVIQKSMRLLIEWNIRPILFDLPSEFKQSYIDDCAYEPIRLDDDNKHEQMDQLCLDALTYIVDLDVQVCPKTLFALLCLMHIYFGYSVPPVTIGQSPIPMVQWLLVNKLHFSVDKAQICHDVLQSSHDLINKSRSNGQPSYDQWFHQIGESYYRSAQEFALMLTKIHKNRQDELAVQKAIELMQPIVQRIVGSKGSTN